MIGVDDKRIYLVTNAADWISLAAAPTFAAMALLTGMLGGEPVAVCPVVHGALLSGMTPMYLLMSAFHSPPWLKLFSRRRHTRRLSRRSTRVAWAGSGRVLIKEASASEGRTEIL
jgi:hypothetical protein